MKKYSEEELLEQIRIRTKELGRIPKTAEIKSYLTIIKKFGTWNNALKQAGYTKDEIYKSRNQYTDGELLNIIKSKTKELGRTPYLKEIKQHRIIIKRFGSWNNALELAGYKNIRNKEITQKEILELIKYKYNKLGKIPKISKFELKYYVYKLFDSWDDALRQAGIEIQSNKKQVKSIKKRYSDEELLQKIKNKYNELGKVPKSYQVEKYTVIIRRFGSWDNALEKAGFDNKELKMYKKTYTKEDLLNMIKEETKKLGRIPNTTEFLHGYSILKNFGTWENALIEAGFNEEDILNRNKKYSNEDLLRMLKEKYTQLERIPKVKDVKKHHSIIRRFGSWNEALKKADLL